MIEKLKRWADRTVPDPFILSLILSLIVFFWAILKSDAGFIDSSGQVALSWYKGFTGKGGLAFALQICFVLITGHALALSPPVQKLVKSLALIPRDGKTAAMLVSFFSCLAAIFHWGLGAIAGALLAREIGRHKKDIHYPILGAAAYSGMALWHGGLSGSAPLKIAEPTNFAAKIAGAIPLEQTLLSNLNYAVTGGLLVLIPIMFYLICPKSVEASDRVDAFIKNTNEKDEKNVNKNQSRSLFVKIQESLFFALFIGISGLAGIFYGLISGGLNFDLNAVNLIFLFLGILLQGNIGRYLKAITEGAGGSGGIILQFPFYFGILGIMKGSGIIGDISNLFLSLSNQTTFPIFAFLGAGLVNMFIPSGGGQFAVQAEILLKAGQDLGVDPAKIIMAFSFGDAWTNMLQPFWALPLLGIMGLKAKDVIAFTALVFLLMLVVLPLLLMLF